MAFTITDYIRHICDVCRLVLREVFAGRIRRLKKIEGYCDVGPCVGRVSFLSILAAMFAVVAGSNRKLKILCFESFKSVACSNQSLNVYLFNRKT